MGNGFELRIGMTTQQVMSNINNMNATDKTKQLIINFCNNDHDKKITNEIELAMLDNWSKGSEKVKMPTAEGMTEFKPFTSNNTVDKDTKYYYSGKNRMLAFMNRLSEGVNQCLSYNRTTYSPQNNDFVDWLTDTNQDGYADNRHLTTTKIFNSDNQTAISYRDDDLDGVFESQDTHETITNGNSYVSKLTSTNSLTGETRVKSTHINDETGDITETTTITDNKTGTVTTRTVLSNNRTGYVTSDTTTVEQIKKTP